MCVCVKLSQLFFFFNDTATTEIYTLSLHDALPISPRCWTAHRALPPARSVVVAVAAAGGGDRGQHRRGLSPVQQVVQLRSEEHTSELQSQSNLVCRLLLEKKKDPNSTDEYTHYIVD